MIEILLILIIVLIAILGYSIMIQLTSIARAIGRNYTLYPAFSEEDIIRQTQKAKRQSELFEWSLESLQKLDAKEKKDIENIDYSDLYKGAYENMIEQEQENEHESEILLYMIEANLAVINGKKTIKETHKEYKKIYATATDRMIYVKKRYKEWLMETRKDRQKADEKLFPFLKKGDVLSEKDK